MPIEFSAMGYLCRLTKMNWRTSHDATEKNLLKNAKSLKRFFKLDENAHV